MKMETIEILSNVILERNCTIEHLELELETLRDENEELKRRLDDLFKAAMQSQEQLQLIREVAGGKYEVASSKIDNVGAQQATPSKEGGFQPWAESEELNNAAMEREQEANARIRHWNASADLMAAKAKLAEARAAEYKAAATRWSPSKLQLQEARACACGVQLGAGAAHEATAKQREGGTASANPDPSTSSHPITGQPAGGSNGNWPLP